MDNKPGFNNIPRTPDFQSIEKGILKFWKENKCFEKLLEQNKGNTKYSFFDGPITANNPMGVHHAFGRTYKDVYQRYQAMLGHDQRFQNGFDCQGLWVEVGVEQNLGLNNKRDIVNYGLKKFSRACKARVEEYAKKITDQSIRLGMWMDWDNLRPNGLGSYYTFTDVNIEHIWHFLKKCQENGWLYKGHKVMPWCARCGTSLSQHELIDSYRDLTHDSVFLRLPLKGREKEYLFVWTTTPWTLTSNVAAAVHPELLYSRVRVGDELYYVSQNLNIIIDPQDEVLDPIFGSDMEGWEYKGPFDELPAQKDVIHKVVLWEEVGATEGTGIVHIAPGCGAEDFELGKEYELPAIAPLDENGYFLPEFGEFSNRHVDESAQRVFDSLKKKGYLYKLEKYTHRYPVCWRCHEELVFRLTDEWFISCDEIRPKMKEAARTVNWVPEYAGKRMQDWLDNMGDWCISRKRYWGLPLPFYECECGNFTCLGSKDELEERAIEGLESLDLAEKEGMKDLTLHKPWIDDIKITCPSCNKHVSRIPDIGDCWLDAGIVPFSTLNYMTNKEYWEAWYPSDMVSEMIEQVKLWFYSQLFMSVTLTGKAPYMTVVTYGSVVDEQYRAMHRSLGNVIWFDEAIEKMGADIMRWIYSGASIRTNLPFGYTIAQNTHRKFLNLWNTYSFFFSNAELDDFNPLEEDPIPVSERSLIDRWLLSKLQLLVDEAGKAMNAYDVRSVVQKTESFVDDLSNVYIRQNRSRFWGSSVKKDALAGYFTLYETLETLTMLLAPIIPFLAEYFYQNLVHSVDPNAPLSVHHCSFPNPNNALIDIDLMKRFDATLNIIYLGRSVRAKKDIIGRQPLQRVLVWSTNPTNLELVKLEELENEILKELNVKEMVYVEDATNLVEYELALNMAIVGPKYKQNVRLLTQALEQSNPIEVFNRVSESQSITLEIEGKKVELSPEEVILRSNEKEGLAVMSDSNFVVALETTLTEPLIQEGLARTLVRHIQNLRKEKDFHVADQIAMWCGMDTDGITLEVGDHTFGTLGIEVGEIGLIMDEVVKSVSQITEELGADTS
ncbi:MAG: isoleucine--tRNA ligase [Promethearchaeota archaeon]